MITKNKIYCSKKLKAVSYIAAVLLSTSLNFNAQAAGLGVANPLQVLHQIREVNIRATHQARIVSIQWRRALRIDDELAYQVKKGLENLSYPIRLGANDAELAIETIRHALGYN